MTAAFDRQMMGKETHVRYSSRVALLPPSLFSPTDAGGAIRLFLPASWRKLPVSTSASGTGLALTGTGACFLLFPLPIRLAILKGAMMVDNSYADQLQLARKSGERGEEGRRSGGEEERKKERGWRIRKARENLETTLGFHRVFISSGDSVDFRRETLP
jgi:hypothetical protein